MKLTQQNFYTEIENSEKPVLVDFFAPWCHPCAVLAPILEKAADDYREKIVFFKVNIDEAPLIADKYGIEQIPTVVIFREGKPVSGFVGLKQEAEIRQWLDNCLDKREENKNPQNSAEEQ